MKGIAPFLASLLLPGIALAQLHLNIGIEPTSPNSRLALAFMERYINDFKDDFKVEFTDYYTEAACKRYANPDIIAFSLIGSNPIYIMGKPTVLAILEKEDIVQLKIQFAEVADSIGNINLNFISNHFIQVKNGVPKFMPTLEKMTELWGSKKIRNVVFHYPPSHQFDDIKANEMIAKIKQLEADWGLPVKDFDYYFAETNQAIQAIKGFDFNFYMGRNDKASGLADSNNKVIFCAGLGEGYFHEVVHIYLTEKFPKSPLHEGIAVNYGGSMGQSLDWHLKRLNEYLKGKPDVDLTNPQSFYYMDEHTNPQHAIQGLLFALVYEKDGIAGAKRLMGYTNMEDIYRQEFKVMKGEENAFVAKAVAGFAK